MWDHPWGYLGLSKATMLGAIEGRQWWSKPIKYPSQIQNILFHYVCVRCPIFDSLLPFQNITNQTDASNVKVGGSTRRRLIDLDIGSGRDGGGGIGLILC